MLDNTVIVLCSDIVSNLANVFIFDDIKLYSSNPFCWHYKIDLITHIILICPSVSVIFKTFIILIFMNMLISFHISSELVRLVSLFVLRFHVQSFFFQSCRDGTTDFWVLTSILGS